MLASGLHRPDQAPPAPRIVWTDSRVVSLAKAPTDSMTLTTKLSHPFRLPPGHGHEQKDLRRYQLHSAKQQISPGSINAAIAALRFFFTVTLERPDLVRHRTIATRRDVIEIERG